MITIQNLYNIVGNKIANETGKAIIRNNFLPQIAEQMLWQAWLNTSRKVTLSVR